MSDTCPPKQRGVASSEHLRPKPSVRPARPFFSSGPCCKRPGWRLASLERALVGRSHRSAVAKERLAQAIERTKSILGLPPGYRVAIMAGSDTGALEAALWSLLGPRPVDVFAWENFGRDWVYDVLKELNLDARDHCADYGYLPDLSAARSEADVIFTWNGTTSGVRVPNADWIADDRQGLTICDATSALFAQMPDWSKLDVASFSWQKSLGAEPAHGVLILGPRAVERLQTHTPSWPVPKLFRLADQRRLDEALFSGTTINTPSMLCLEDYLDALDWVETSGGTSALKARADANLAVVADWVEKTSWVEFLCPEPAYRSNTSVTLRMLAPAGEADARAVVTHMVRALEAEEAAYDLGAYRTAPPGLRLWCGPTVESADVATVLPWLDWAYGRALADSGHLGT